MRLELATLGCFVVGALLLVAFETPVTLALGVLLLLAFVGLGTLLFAGPDAERRLGRGDRDDGR